MSNYGLKVSQPHQDADTNDQNKLLFSSDTATHSILKIFDKSISSTSYQFEHGLNYVPKVWINSVNEIGANDKRIPIGQTSGNGAVDYETDKTSIKIQRGVTTRT